MNYKPDLVLITPHLHTMTHALPQGSTAIAISDGRIVRIASANTAHEWAARDLVALPPGSTLLPGLVDSHTHPIMGLALTEGIDLSGARDLSEARDLIAAEAQRGGTRGWVLGWGLDPNLFGAGNAPHRRSIEDATGNVPAFIRLFDAHSALVNQAAIDLAHLESTTTLPAGAEVVHDAYGSPTGLLQEFAAMSLVESQIPKETEQDRKARLFELLQKMAASGLTAGFAMDALDDPEQLLASAEQDGDLPIKLRLSPWVMPTDDLHAIVERLGRHGRRWRIEGVKLFLDGTIDNGTAWLDAPDHYGQSRESTWSDPEAYARCVLALDAMRIPTATHAIGDAAVAHALDVLHRTLLNAHHRIEHLETMPIETVRLLAHPRIAASMQPTHCTHFTNADHSDNWSIRLGRQRADEGWRTRDILNLGATLALGSDWPIAPFPPLTTMADAQLRRIAGRPELAPSHPEQGLTAREALAGYTTSAHASIGETGGTITVGAAADFTVLDRDPLTTPPDELAEANVLMALVDRTFSHRII
ncbi:MAG: amidohydrolase [Leifsonia sp.]